MSVLFRFLTAGESHGEALVAVIDGIPAGLPLTEGHINEDLARRPGSGAHDEILFDAESGFRRSTNNAGGLEGGVTNSQPVVARAVMKPPSTLRTPLKSVDLATKEAVEAVVERSDVCAVPAAGIVGETMMAIVLAGAFLEKFGGDKPRGDPPKLRHLSRQPENLVALLRR